MSRGRDARSPYQIPPAGLLDTAARIFARLGTVPVGLLAAGVAFYGLFSLFPAITAGVALTGLFYDPEVLVSESQWLLDLLPPSAGKLIESQLEDVAGAEGGSLGLAAIVSLAVALWSSSNATASLVQGLNVIYEEGDERGFFATRLLVIALTIAIIIGLGLAVAIVAALPAWLSLVGAGPGLIDTVLFVRWPLIFVLGIMGIASLYRFGPDRRSARWRWLGPGALLAGALWVTGTFGFSYYVQSFGNYNETFGTLAGVVVLLTWFWLSAFVLLLGAAVDAELEAQTRCDSTVGPDRPMGERGAVKADRLGEARGETRPEEPQPADAR